MKRIILAGAAALAATVSQPVFAEVIKSDESGFVTRDTAVTSADPYETWAQLIAPSKWWNDDHTWSADAENMYISAQGGGCFCELLPPPKGAPEGVRRGSVEHMRVIQAAPPRVLRMVGGLGPLQSEPMTGVLTITLKPVDGGTRVLFEYVVGGYSRFEPGVIAKAVDGVMTQQLKGLVSSLGVAEPSQARDEDAAGAEAPSDTDDGDAERVTETDAETNGDTGQGDGPTNATETSPLDAEDFLLEPGE